MKGNFMEDKYIKPLNKMTTQERCRYEANFLKRSGFDKPGTYEHDQVMVFEEAAEKIDQMLIMLENAANMLKSLCNKM